MRGVRLTLWLVMAALWLGGPSPAGAQTWCEVKGENFTVFSDASERRVRTIAWQFEQMRAAMAEGLPWATVRLDRPVVVIAARDEHSMRALVPQYWEQRGGIRPASVFIGGPDRYYIALRADVEVEDQGQNPHAAAYWAAEAGSTSYWTYYRLASLRAGASMSSDEHAALVPWLEWATTLNPQSAVAFAFLADIQASVNRTDAAIASAQRALELDRDNVTHALRLARLLVTASRLDEARSVASAALPLATPQQRAMLESVIGLPGN